MSKEKETSKTTPDSAFAGFNILKGSGGIPNTVEEQTEEVKETIAEEPIKVETKVTTKEPKKKEVKKETVVETEEETETEEVETPEAEIEETTETEETEEVEIEEDKIGPFKAFANHLKEKGIVDFEDEEIEDSEEGIAKVVDKVALNKHEAWKKSYPEDAQKFLEFIEGGGNPKDFIDIYYNPSSFEDIKLTEKEAEDTELQKHIIKEGLALSGMDEAEIEHDIQLYEDGGKLEAKAKYHLDRLQKWEKNQKERLLLSQAEVNKKKEEDNKKVWEEFRKGLFDKEEINGFKLTPKLKESVWNHMTKPVNKEGQSQLEINNKTKKEAQYVYALLDYLNWDVTKLERQVKNKVVSKLKDKLSNFSDGRTKISKKGVTEVGEEEGTESSFGGFAKLLKGQ